MSDAPSSVQDFVAQHLHSRLFLEEFTFARNKFTPPDGSELELADAVVLLGDVLLVVQIKERVMGPDRDSEAERKWFNAKVLGKATKQVRDTLAYLNSYDQIHVPNERGRIFNLAGRLYATVIKLVVYQGSECLPDDCRSIRHHISGTGGGFIHILQAHDYWQLGRLLRMPEEMVRYFQHREAVLTKYPLSAGVPEAALAGHFIGRDMSVAPTINDHQILHRTLDDEAEWNLMPLLRGMHDHVSAEGGDYHEILLEFARLPRSAWYEIKKRVVKCIENVNEDEFSRPYRITCPQTGCGFVFIPVMSEISDRSDWAETKIRALKNLTAAHKYDQRLNKCVGILFAKDGQHFDIQWMLMEHTWEEDAEFQTQLDKNFPFRPVKPAMIYGYHTMSEDG